MRVIGVVNRMGGVADAHALIEATSRRRVRTALRKGEIVRDARGRYALPVAGPASRAAARVGGVITHASAAARYGWEMKHPPPLPTITVGRDRKISPERRAGIDLKYRDIPASDIRQGVTLPGPTVIDCAKTMPFDEAVAIADSAQRHDDVTKEELIRLAEQVPSVGRARCLRVAHASDGRAANPFESVLRAIGRDVHGLELLPQVTINEAGFWGRPDLVDERRRIVVEAESFEFHTGRKAFKKDCYRYNALVLRGWLVLRFSWEHVMFEPDYVAECLRSAAAMRPMRRTRRKQGPQRPATSPVSLANGTENREVAGR